MGPEELVGGEAGRGEEDGARELNHFPVKTHQRVAPQSILLPLPTRQVCMIMQRRKIVCRPLFSNDPLTCCLVHPLPNTPTPYPPILLLVQAVDAGAKVLCGGGPPPDEDAASTDRNPGMGYYVSPTVLTGVKETDEAWTTEIFGPVLCIREFQEEGEAVAAANDSEYGLAAAVMSADNERCEGIQALANGSRSSLGGGGVYR